MTVFGPDWKSLQLEDIEMFLRDAESEPLLWEAKGTKLDVHEVRRQVCGFANSHEGGYLILGAKWGKSDRRWVLDPLVFPDEPGPWVGRTVREGGVRPVPDIDTLAWPVGDDGRQVAVVKVDPFAAPPCNSRGTVYERVSGETIAVRDPQRLADLFARGEYAHRAAQVSALAAAESAYYEARQHQSYDGEHVQFALGLACIGRADDLSARLFTAKLEECATKGVRDLTARGPFAPVIDAQWSQTRIVVRGMAGGIADHDAIAMAKWDGGVAVYDRIATEHTSRTVARRPSGELRMGDRCGSSACAWWLR